LKEKEKKKKKKKKKKLPKSLVDFNPEVGQCLNDGIKIISSHILEFVILSTQLIKCCHFDSSGLGSLF